VTQFASTSQVDLTMIPERAALLLQRAISRGIDPEIEVWVVRALRLWWESQGSIPVHRALGLPTTPMRASLLIRDAWLREAGRLVSGETSWQRASALAHELRHAIRNRTKDFTSTLEFCLVQAIASGAPMPDTRERLYQILETDSEKDLAAHALTCLIRQ
jgi:hypothetical protein